MVPQSEGGGRFAVNIMHFGRALRAAGLPVGPGHTLRALAAVETIGVGSRTDLYWTLHSVFVNRQDQRELFDQCFHIFWRDPQILERLMQMLLPTLNPEQRPEGGAEANRRVAEALSEEKEPGRGEAPEDEEDDPDIPIEFDAVMTFSQQEILQTKDFEQMSAEELAAARRQIAKLRLPIQEVPTRRFTLHDQGRRIDMRKTLRQSLRGSGETIDIAKKMRVKRHPPLVILCDISGSMSRYSRMLLLFMHAITSDRDRVFSFVFGTRLTNITRQLRHKDIDIALDRVGDMVADWSGGTRIGACLKDFNQHWSRRVLGQGALVLLISDGLDRDAAAGLEPEMERLHKSCRRLIWLNPLLRFDRFEPISSGARAIIQHVDDFRSVHNLSSLSALSEVLSASPKRQAEGISDWVERSQRTSSMGNGHGN